ncbi:flagellar hook-basal body complex protein FliE [Polycyclovorans algicola]|uniref:flagellar hook-basal body complex protein FliE n=1 Tax=Polycyclovorans algicola TaxID=616992 RepID=UPI0004A6EA61
MREIRSRSALPNLDAGNAIGGGKDVKPSAFAERLGDAIKGVNDKQMTAASMAQEFELGRGDLASTMVAMQKSQVAFRATVEVRNRVVQAYQDVMNMPL